MNGQATRYSLANERRGGTIVVQGVVQEQRWTMIAVCLDGNHWTDVRFVRVGYYGFDMCPVHWEREFEERFHEIALYVEENEDAYVHTRYALPPNPPEDIVPTLEWGEDPRQW